MLPQAGQVGASAQRAGVGNISTFEYVFLINVAPEFCEPAHSPIHVDFKPIQVLFVFNKTYL